MFGTDGIRQKFDTYPINKLGITQIAYSIHKWLLQTSISRTILNDSNSHLSPNCKKILISRDSRPSGLDISSWLVNVFSVLNYDVFITDIISTPILAYAALNGVKIDNDVIHFDCSIMITASHNTHEYNGIKIFKQNGQKLSNNDEKQITELCHLLNDDKNNAILEFEQLKLLLSSEQNIIYHNIHNDVLNSYIEFLKQNISQDSIKNKKILFDCANGAMSSIAKQIFHIFLNGEIIFINTSNEPEEINKNTGVVNYDILKQNVQLYDADYGFAFDGDGDRIIGCDSNGIIIDGDQILALFAISTKYFNDFLANLSSTIIVSTLDSNSAFFTFLSSINIKYEISDVGDKNVAQAMMHYNSDLGGENSGHILTKFNKFCGDGVVICILLLKIIEQIKNMEQSRTDDMFLSIFPIFSPNIKLKYNIDKEKLTFILHKLKEIIKSHNDSVVLNKNNHLHIINHPKTIDSDDVLVLKNLCDTSHHTTTPRSSNKTYEIDNNHNPAVSNGISEISYHEHNKFNMEYTYLDENYKNIEKFLKILAINHKYELIHFNMRPSGTEPVIRLAFELKNNHFDGEMYENDGEMYEKFYNILNSIFQA